MKFVIYCDIIKVILLGHQQKKKKNEHLKTSPTMEDQKKLEKVFYRMKKKTFLNLSQLGASIEELEKDFEISFVPVGNINALKDFVWGQLNKHLARYPTDFQKQHSIYKSMAYFDYDYSDGKRVLELKLNAMSALKSLQKECSVNEYLHAEILSFPTSCPVCWGDHGKTFELDKYFSTDILPHKNCTCEGFGCVCTIIFPRNGKKFDYEDIELTDDDD